MSYVSLGLFLVAVGVIMAIMAVPYSGLVAVLGAITLLVGLFLRSRI